MTDRFDEMADRVLRDLFSVGFIVPGTMGRGVISQALRAAHARGVEEGAAQVGAPQGSDDVVLRKGFQISIDSVTLHVNEAKWGGRVFGMFFASVGDNALGWRETAEGATERHAAEAALKKLAAVGDKQAAIADRMREIIAERMVVES